MQKSFLPAGIVLGIISSAPLIAFAYLGNALTGLSFAPFDLFDWLARVLPGGLVTLGIDTLVATLRALGLSVRETAKLAEQLMALGIFVVAGGVMGLFLVVLRRRTRLSGAQAGALAGLPLFFLLLLALTGLGASGNLLFTVVWLLLLSSGWGAVLALVMDRVSRQVAAAEEPDAARREALLKVAGGSLGLALGAWWLGRLATGGVGRAAESSGAGQPLPTSAGEAPATSAPAVEFPPTPAGRVQPAPGTRPEVTSNEEFYRIDINTRPPVIDGSAWQLEIAGLFETTESLTIEDLMAFPSVTRPITLSCISNRVGGDLIGTSYWTGLRLRDLLNELRLQPEAGALFVEAVDGFYETVVAVDMMDERTLLVYGMNGQTLPVEHGYPLRIYIPNRYGMKQPKWITRIEAVEAWRPGYWVERGWSREARPKIVSVIDTIAVDAISEGLVPVGGIAWAGDRGIQKVELRVDDGPWQEAQLRKPPLNHLTWVQWRYGWSPTPGRHRLEVRATDGMGEVQTAEIGDPHPDGATGYHSRSISL